MRLPRSHQICASYCRDIRTWMGSSGSTMCMWAGLPLLSRHRDMPALLRGDQVVGVLGVFAQIDLHPADPAREGTVLRPVIVADGRGAVSAHVGGLVGGE